MRQDRRGAGFVAARVTAGALGDASIESLTRMAWVGFGGAVGSVLRYVLSGWVQQSATSFPLGTLLVNVVGCLIIGFLGERFANQAVDGEVRLAVMVGLLGGFTTFSAFSAETLRLAQDRQFASTMANVLGTVVSCLVAVWIGQRLAKWIAMP